MCRDFFLSGFFLTRFQRFQQTIQGPAGERRELSWFLSTTSTRSRTFRHLFETLHLRWLALIFIRAICIYQTPTGLIDDGMLISVYLHDFDIGLLWQQFEIGNWRIQTCIDCHPCIKKANRLTKTDSHPDCMIMKKDPPWVFKF